MEAPKQIEPRSVGDYLDVMSKSVFQSGISWKVVEAKWPGTREAFKGFAADAVADMTPDELDQLSNDTRVIRNRRKLERQHGSFKAYLRSHGGFENTVADLRKQFKFLGDMGAFHFLYVVNEEVPSYEDWCASRGRTPKD